MKTSIIRGYFGSYKDAYDAVGEQFKKSRNFSIQHSTDYKMHPYVLIYYGNFI